MKRILDPELIRMKLKDEVQATHAYVNPLIAVMLGHVVLKEQLPATILLAGALILAAVILITRTACK